ncbi:Vacuolar protein sorting-associated protein 9a [Yarrowia sp. C11]|nr:Vacuolar protein sorting-associated protein 9a [Yarrowia sp. C11]KAG5371153.1 Vacuolar protein sorting-associated protein 9a [Yarrowia sp. E02]
MSLLDLPIEKTKKKVVEEESNPPLESPTAEEVDNDTPADDNDDSTKDTADNTSDTSKSVEVEVAEADPESEAGSTTSATAAATAARPAGSSSGNEEKATPSSSDDNAPFDFQRFLDLLRHKNADPIARYLKSFLSEFNKKRWTVNEQVKIIGDFKEFISNKIQQMQTPPFVDMTENELINMEEGIEKLIMNRLYSKTYSPEVVKLDNADSIGVLHAKNPDAAADGNEEDLIRDHVLQEKLQLWGWIEGGHLDIDEKFWKQGASFVTLASEELRKINNYRAPRDKMICVLNCCKVIFGLLRQTKSEESADGFLPLLIYVVIKAQPQHLTSNLNYIQRFRSSERLSGEPGYYLSSLLGAVAFVEQLDKSSLSITDEDFDANLERTLAEIAEKNAKKEQEAAEEAKMKALAPPETPGRADSQSPALSAESSTPSNILMSSAGLITSPFKSLSKFFEGSFDDVGASTEDATPQSEAESIAVAQGLSHQEAAARQASAEEYEAQRIQNEEHASVVNTLHQMFPTLDREIIEDIVREKKCNVGAAVDYCLMLVGES